uniref:Ion transport domain-containing protein n=1 Tax=Ditylenchus dipsaci TaxID=166011 RepID=A0A915DIF7_9BILA
MTCSAYPLDTLDTIRPDGSTNYDSALMTVINGSTPEHLEMIGSEVIQRLLADKWKAYASRKLYERLALLIGHLLCLCFVVYMRPTEKERLYMESGSALWPDYVRTVFEVLTIMSCCWFVFIQQLDELRTQGLYGYVRNLKTAPAKVMEESLLVFALPGSWIFLLFFARSAKLTGPFVQMIYSMIAGDMIRFAIISSIFLVSFSQVFYFVGKDMSKKQRLPKNHPNHCAVEGYTINTYSSYLETFITLFRASMGGYDYEEFSCTNYEPLTKTLFVFYMFIMPIMMINILIAMMGNTYTQIITQAEKAWRQQYAQIVMVLERSMNKQRLATCQLEYSIKLNDPGRETRGLMVIKQTKKTKARQRKQAINNWKHIGRKVNVMVKELGGEHAKFLLHSHDRIITDPEGAATTTVAVTTGGGQVSAAAGTISSQVGRSNRSLSNVSPGSHGLDAVVIEGQNSLSSVVTHANNVIQNKKEGRNGRLYQAVAYHQRLFSGHSTRHQVHSGAPHNHVMLPNGNVAPGRRHLVTSSGGISASAIQVVPPGLDTPQPSTPTTTQLKSQMSSPSLITPSTTITAPNNHHHYVHTTQRQLAAVAGSRVRGVEMLPSVDIPNIPSSMPAVVASPDTITSFGVDERRSRPTHRSPPTARFVSARKRAATESGQEVAVGSESSNTYSTTATDSSSSANNNQLRSRSKPASKDS